MPREVDGEMLLSTGEAGRRLGVTRVTVREWIKRGLLPALRTPTGRFLVRADDLAVVRRRPYRLCDGKGREGRGHEQPRPPIPWEYTQDAALILR